MIKRLRGDGWEGPDPGGSHWVMRKGARRLTIPNSHKGDIDWSLTKKILKQAGISPEEWDKLA
ncbi:MAG: type II toxin-antitoxin system HicA family toxin [Verrucomicrobiaceae bacterium]|nr:type II toxin-antitoxin system HicA family toxin [Verrucomicrobiaceae bacterium]